MPAIMAIVVRVPTSGWRDGARPRRVTSAALMRTSTWSARLTSSNTPASARPSLGVCAPPPIGPAGEVPTGERPPIGGPQDRTTFASDSVYFDYDSAKIKPSEVSKLEAVAAGLKGNNKTLIIEGNTDERGTAEYNRALGERRAGAARSELIRLGIAPSRVTTISYGKDRPADTGHDDAAHAKNRRDEFVLVGQ